MSSAVNPKRPNLKNIFDAVFDIYGDKMDITGIQIDERTNECEIKFKTKTEKTIKYPQLRLV